jgi:hypothetical protein
MKIDFLKIKSKFLPPKEHKESLDSYIASMEKLVKSLIPKALFESEISPPHFLSYQSYFQKLNQSLPIVKWTPLGTAPCSISIAILCSAEFTHGTGRFLSDTIARNLIPGKQIPITMIRSLNFSFIIQPKDRYFVTEIYVDVENERELHQATQTLPRLAEDLRLTLLAIQHARKLVLSKPLTLDEKRMLLLENLSSLVEKPKDHLDHHILEDTYHLLLRVAYAEKQDEIPDHLLPLIEKTPKSFDHNMFQTMQSLILAFGKEMISSRSLHHLYHTLSYLYLFRKVMSYRLKNRQNEHLISIKVLRTMVDPKTPVLAILICTNFLSDREELDQEQLVEVISSYLPRSHLVPRSLINFKDENQMGLMYLEMAKDPPASFSQSEVRELKRKLPKKIHQLYHSPIVQRPHDHNEEEVTRNILKLCKELNTPEDPPPVIIHFSNETNTHLIFTVILVCLQSRPIQFMQASELKVLFHQSKIAGILGNRYLQNAHILEVQIDKSSSDQKKDENELYQARKTILSYLKKHFGPVKDYNSGMIVKQYENLCALKKLVLPTPLVEKYFYSIKPGYMQSLLSVKTLKNLYDLVCQGFKASFSDSSYAFDSVETDEELLLMVSSPIDGFIDQIKREISSLFSSPANISISDVSMHGIRVLGCIFSVEDLSLRKDLSNQIQTFIKSLDPLLVSTLY